MEDLSWDRSGTKGGLEIHLGSNKSCRSIYFGKEWVYSPDKEILKIVFVWSRKQWPILILIVNLKCSLDWDWFRCPEQLNRWPCHSHFWPKKSKPRDLGPLRHWLQFNWEPEFMTIFVTWQLIVTLDSIRNSCDVFKRASLTWKHDGHDHCHSFKVKTFLWQSALVWVALVML